MQNFKDLGEELLQQTLCTHDLLWFLKIINHFSERAWAKIVAQRPSAKTLRKVIDEIPPLLKEKACEELLEKTRKTDDCRVIMQIAPSLQQKAWEKLKELEPTAWDLDWVKANVPSLREEADFILKTMPTFSR